MVKTTANVGGGCSSELSRQSFNSVPSVWDSSRSLAAPRRWTPVHFSPLSPGVVRSNYCNFETVQSLPTTPVPPLSPTFSEPAVHTFAANADTYEEPHGISTAEKSNGVDHDERPFRPRPFAHGTANSTDPRLNPVGAKNAEALGRNKWSPMGQQEEMRQIEPAKETALVREATVPEIPRKSEGVELRSTSSEPQRLRSWSNPGTGPSGDAQLSANLNAQKLFSCSTNDMANDYCGSPSTTVNHDFFSPYIRGPTFKATARAGQQAVWSPKTRAPPGGNELSSAKTLARETPLAPLAQAEGDINLNQPTGVSSVGPLPSKVERAVTRPPPWELSTEPSARNSSVTRPLLEGAPPPPPPLPMSQKSAGAAGSREVLNPTSLPNESNVEGRSTVVIPETESVASLRSKIQSQLTMAKPKHRFQQAQVDVRDEQNKYVPTEPMGSIRDRARELELMRSAAVGRPKQEEELPVHPQTDERLFDKLRSPTPQTLSLEAASLTSNESSTRRTPMLSELRSPSPPTIPPTPAELLSPTSRSDLPSYGNYTGTSRFPSDNWASRTLNRAPARPTFQTNTIQRGPLREERRPSKDYQHQWYKMMFKKLHQIDKNEDSAVMHYRVRDHLGEKPVRDRSPVRKTQQSYSAERSRQFLSPEPVPPDTTVTYRYNRSKSVGRSSSPTSSATFLSLPTDEKHPSHAAVGFHHQPRRIEDYTPGHSSIVESTTLPKEASGSAAAKQSSIQAMLDNSQGLIQRILGDLSREVEQHKANLENYSDIDFWLVGEKPSPKCIGKVDAATQVVRPADSRSSRFERLSALVTPPRIRGAPHRGRIYSWSHPVRYRDPGSKLYALERSKAMSFHLPPFRLREESDSRDGRLLQRITEAWEKNSAEPSVAAECSDKAVQSDESPSVLQQRHKATMEKESAYDKLFEELAKAIEDIERMSVAGMGSPLTNSNDHPRRRSRSLGDTNGSERRSHWSLRSVAAIKPARHSISSCAVPFCPFCSGRNGRPESSCTSFGSDSFYFGTNVDSTSDVSFSVDTNTECLTYRPALSACDTGSPMQRQKHQVPRCKSALDHPRSFNARKSEHPRIIDFDRLDIGQRKPDSFINYGKPVLARVLYSFVSQNPRELDLYPDDTVTIRRQIDANWCEGEVGGRVGIFPTNYVEPLTEKSTTDTRDAASTRRGRSTAKVLYDFVARRPRELSIKQGEIVHLIREVDRNWSLGCNEQGQEGMFPSHYVKPCDGVADRKPTEPLTLRKAYQPHSGPSRFASAFDGHSTFGSRPTDRVSKLMIDGVTYDGSVKADSLDAILNEMKLYSSSLLESKSSKRPPTQTSSAARTVNHSAMYASKIDTYEAVYDYKPENPDELELKRGDIVYVVESYDDGWFIGTSLRTGRFGTFPGNYVKRL